MLEGKEKNRRIGVWALSMLATDAGGWRSINRIGLPIANGTAEDPEGYAEKVAHRICPNIFGREHANQPWDRERISDVEAFEKIPVRSRRCGRNESFGEVGITALGKRYKT